MYIKVANVPKSRPIVPYLVQWSIPTNEGTGGEEEKVQNCQAKDCPLANRNEVGQRPQEIHEQRANVEHPQVVRHLKEKGAHDRDICVMFSVSHTVI
jgi:hypothetical protein